jgi:hypothetical protein
MTDVIAHLDHVFAADHLAELDRELDTALLAADLPQQALDLPTEPLIKPMAGLRSPVWYQ